MLRVKQLEEQLQGAQLGTIYALTMLLDLKDLKTGLHATRLAEWGVRVGEHLGLSEAELKDVECACLLHDIGKIGVPDAILLKPAALTDDEMAVIKKHPEYGWGILRSVPGFDRASLLVLHHHERMDGGGYPAGLEGEEIPLGSRIVAVVDAFDAMISRRAYRDGLPAEEALERLDMNSGGHFDPEIVGLFSLLAARHLDEISRIQGLGG